jgi:hypothetical protein
VNPLKEAEVDRYEKVRCVAPLVCLVISQKHIQDGRTLIEERMVCVAPSEELNEVCGIQECA